MKKFWKSINICRSCGQLSRGSFFNEIWCSYYGSPIQSHRYLIHPCQFRWPWVILKLRMREVQFFPQISVCMLVPYNHSDQFQHANPCRDEHLFRELATLSIPRGWSPRGPKFCIKNNLLCMPIPFGLGRGTFYCQTWPHNLRHTGAPVPPNFSDPQHMPTLNAMGQPKFF